MFKRKNKIQKRNKSDDFELVLLKSINNEYEFNMVKGILNEHKIPYIVKEHGIGGYMRIISGTSNERVDILVEKSAFEKAKAILEQFGLEE